MVGNSAKLPSKFGYFTNEYLKGHLEQQMSGQNLNALTLQTSGFDHKDSFRWLCEKAGEVTTEDVWYHDGLLANVRSTIF